MGVSLVLLEIPDDSWIKQNLIAALDLLTIEGNFQDINSSNTPETAAGVWSLILQTLLFDYEPPMEIPVGTIEMWVTDTPPDGWLACDGSEVSRTTYADLFDLWGTTFGIGDGSTTFTLPQFLGRSPVGEGGTFDLNDLGGNGTHTLTTAQLPSHNHGITDPGHTHPPLSPATLITGTHAGGATNFTGTASGTRDNQATTGSATTGISTNNTGSGSSFDLYHPYRVVMFIVKAIAG